MKDLNSVKKEIKSILGNFNPEKSTYKILNDIVNNNYDVNHIIDLISKIRGVNKYPDELKNKFSLIVSSLKEISKVEENKKQKEQLRKKEEEEKKKISKQQEENTKELKDIIESIEKSSMKRRNQKVVKKDNIVEKDLGKTFENVEDESNDTDLEGSNNKFFDFESEKVSFVLIGLILICIISLILIFLFY